MGLGFTVPFNIFLKVNWQEPRARKYKLAALGF